MKKPTRSRILKLIKKGERFHNAYLVLFKFYISLKILILKSMIQWQTKLSRNG